MSDIALKILRKLQRDGDAALEEIARIIPKRHKDHRDFYVLVSLIARGLIVEPFISTPEKEIRQTNEQVLAYKYFAMSTADTSTSYKNYSWSISGDGETLKAQRLALSGLGYLYLSERATKRFDRAFAIGSGIFIGVAVALIAVLIERYIKGA